VSSRDWYPPSLPEFAFVLFMLWSLLRFPALTGVATADPLISIHISGLAESALI
jgi:hypothetical protein